MPSNIGQKMQQLFSQFGHLPGITIELHKELLAIQVENEQASATVFLQGAQLSHFQPKGEGPVIWCSEHCSYQEGESLRGGIPICWPWFGDIKRNPESVQKQLSPSISPVPAHGFVRNKEWTLNTIDIIDDHSTRLTFDLNIEIDDEALWPYACHLQCVFTIGAELSIQLIVNNLSDSAIHFTSALHSYFSISHIDHAVIEGVDQLHYIDCLDDWQLHKQLGTLCINQEVDRVYKGTAEEPITIIDTEQRTITLNSEGSNSAVIWNPWIDKSKRLSDFSDQDYQTMLCIETANALDDLIRLEPSQQHCMTLTIKTNNSPLQ